VSITDEAHVPDGAWRSGGFDDIWGGTGVFRVSIMMEKRKSRAEINIGVEN
jgi:hypothetical protein